MTAEPMTPELYESVLNAVHDGLWVTDEEDRIIFFNRGMERIAGTAASDVLGASVTTAPQKEVIGAFLPHYRSAKETLRTVTCEVRVPAAGGQSSMHAGSITPLVVDGHFRGMICNVKDVTQTRRTEIALAQSQKLEAIGRLASGIAHDSNNLLMGIMNYVDLCRDRVGEDHQICEWLDEITSDAERSAAITRQLLTFASKQTVAPRVLDLNDAVSGTLRMLLRLIGEDIDLVWQPGSEVWPVRIDPSQLDQILTNLAVNARDAIGAGGGGRIRIATLNASIDEACCDEHVDAVAGEYVVIIVSDNGCGMDADALRHVFEPFYTTKAEGKGSGLGLATVRKTVKQSGGFVHVHSERGLGTTFRVYLPRHHGRAVDSETGRRKPDPMGGSERILLVEDEKSIRLTLALFLEDLGYTVLVAAAPAEAIQLVADEPGPVDLLITDMVMPGMNGRALAEALCHGSPALKVLYMSGYGADIVAHHGVLGDGVNFVSKPIACDALAHRPGRFLTGSMARTRGKCCETWGRGNDVRGTTHSLYRQADNGPDPAGRRRKERPAYTFGVS